MINIEFSDLMIEAYTDATATGCEFELRVRLLADNNNLDFLNNLSEVIKNICKEFKLSSDEKKTLHSCVYLRNKLFHLDLSKATKKLVSLGTILNRGKVWSIDLDDYSSITKITDSSSESEKLFGWLLEAFNSDSFKKSQDLFLEGIKIYEKRAVK